MAFLSGLVSVSLLLLFAGFISGQSYLLQFHNDARLAAACMFIMIGCMHIVKPKKLTYMIESWLPYALQLVILSGTGEILFGAGLLFAATQWYAAWGLTILLILMFPANIYVAVKQLPAPGGLPAKPWYTWSRLAFQPVYIAWIWLSL